MSKLFLRVLWIYMSVSDSKYVSCLKKKRKNKSVLEMEKSTAEPHITKTHVLSVWTTVKERFLLAPPSGVRIK